MRPESNRLTTARARAALLLGRLRDFAVAPSLSGGRGNEQAASGVDKEATFDHFHRFYSRDSRNAQKPAPLVTICLLLPVSCLVRFNET